MSTRPPFPPLMVPRCRPGLQFPTSEDWLGLWCPASISPYDSSPVKYQMLSADPSYMSGNGTIRFYLVC